MAVTARAVAGSIGLSIDTALALGIGLAAGTVPSVRSVILPGARLAAQQLLRIGVALLGARLTIDAVVEGGTAAIVGASVIVAVGLALGLWVARRMALPGRLGLLIAVGMAICGNSAILAMAPVVRAEDRETTYAVSTITIFGLVAVLVLPVLGHALGLADGVFGTWAGLSVNDTAQVVATGYAFSPPAGDVATIVKLTRNLAIAPVLIGAALLVGGAQRHVSTRVAVARAVPWFVAGFLALAGIRSLGLLDGALPWGGTLADALSAAANWLILVALAGVGASADLRSTIGIGPRPFLLGLVLWLVILALGMALATVVGGTVYDGLT
ncbi:YeiH family protein [soil metagenome]